MTQILATNIVNKFKCLQADCPDTCCKGWSMQLDDATYAKYQGTPLEAAVAHDGNLRVMKRGADDVCVKFEGGKCGIHAQFGDNMLGDACNFYPRVTRKLAEQTLMTATLSCPEIVRLSLEDGGFDYAQTEQQRLPELKSTSGELAVHNVFLEQGAKDANANSNMARIFAVSESLANLNVADWVGASAFMFKIADSKILPPEVGDADELNIYLIFLGLLHATHKTPSARLLEVMAGIEAVLGVKIDRATMNIEFLPTKKPKMAVSDADLNSYLKAQMSFNTYPYAGIGANISDKARILVFKYALTKLALSSCGDKVIAIQALARILDHLADPKLMLSLLDQLKFNSHARIFGLIMQG